MIKSIHTDPDKSLEQAQILGIDLNITRKERVLRFIRSELVKKAVAEAKRLVVTPNPEQIMRARHDSVYRNILNSATIKLPDGVGLAAAYTFLKKEMPQNKIVRFCYAFFYGLWVGFAIVFDRKKITSEMKIIRGRDFFFDLMKLANKQKLRVYLLGSRQKVAQKAAESLKSSFQKVQIVASDAPELDQNARTISSADREMEVKIISDIKKFKPHLLILGISPPKQEKWLKRNWDVLDFGFAFCFGATLDFVAGNLPMPPKWMDKAGLEWVWRLITSKKTGKSVKRIFSAFPGFPLVVFWQKVASDQ